VLDLIASWINQRFSRRGSPARDARALSPVPLRAYLFDLAPRRGEWVLENCVGVWKLFIRAGGLKAVPIDATPDRSATMCNLSWAIPLFSVFAFGSLGTASLSPERAACGAPVSGLTLCLASVSGTDSASVEIRNDGSSDVLIQLGIMIANGAHQYPNAITLVLSDSNRVEIEGTLIDPPGVAGRVDPLVIPLPAGAAFRIPLRLSRYVFHAAGQAGELDFGGQRRAIRAKLTGRRPDRSELISFWTGTAVSNAITVVLPGTPK
jgi:hypothetical protein